MASVEQIRAARALLNWSQQDLATAAGLSQTGIARIENGTNKPTSQTLDKIVAAFRKAYIEFVPDGVRRISDIVTIRYGDQCYLELLDDAFNELAPVKGEVLFWAADERRSSLVVTEKTRSLRRAGVRTRFLIREGDDYFMGKPEEYRWLPEKLFVDSDVRVIFGNKTSYFVSWHESLKIITIRDEHIAQENRRLFNFLWDGAQGPHKSSAPARYE